MKSKSNPIIFIPARGGSKRIKNKNMQKLGNKPLIKLALENAFQISNNVYVSTDNENISNYSQKNGAEVHRRPKYLSTDNASIEDAVRHFIKSKLQSYDKNQVLIIMSACSPFIKSKSIMKGVKYFETFKCDSLISSHKSYEDYWIIKNKKIKRIRNNEPRRQQDRVPYYIENSAFYITRLKFLLSKSSIIDGKVNIFEVNELEGFDINTLLDLQIANFIYQNKSKFI